MPESVPNYLQQDASGAVSAVFPGGVKIDAATSLASPITERSVVWVRQPDGAVIAVVEGTYDAGLSTAELDSIALAPSAGDTAVATMMAARGTPAAMTSPAVFAVQSSPGGGTNLRTTVQAGTFVKTVLDGAGQSSFLQLLAGSNLQLQVFTVTMNAVPVGTATVTVALPNIWPTSHLFFAATPLDYGGSGTGAEMQSSVNGPTQGTIRIWGNPVLQTIRATCLSFGN